MSAKLVHLFDETTGAYCGDYLAQESPLEPGEFITPIHSTDVPVLPDVEGKTRNFVSGEWVYIDIPKPPPPPPPTAQEQIQAQIAAIEAQFTTTLQMRVSLQEPEAITQVQGMYTQIAALKAQL